MANLSNINNKFLVTTGGDVGIGVTGPTSKLQVGPGTSNADRSLIASLGGTDNNVLSALSLVNTSGNDAIGYGVCIDFHLASTYSPTGRIATIAEDTSVKAGMAFYTYESGGLDERMRIASDGNVGIGVTPNDWDPTITALQIDAVSISAFQNNVMLIGGNAYYDDTANAYKYINDGFASQLTVNNSGNFEFKTAGSGTAGNTVSLDTKVKILNNGDVGIGTGSPGAKLEISGTTEGRYLQVDAIAGFAGLSSGSGAMVEFLNAGDGNNVKIKTNNSVRTDAAPFSVWTDTNSRFIIRNDGNVGIGTASPTALLDLGNSIQDNKVHLYASGNDKYGMGIRGSQFLFYSGGLGSGSGGITFGKMTGTTYTENMRVTNDGNVGIGTTNPSYKLEVQGDAYINGRDFGKPINYASAQGWVAADPTSNQTAFFNGNFAANGGSTENKVYWDYNYAGQRALIWRSQNNDAGSNADGGWNKMMDVASNNMGYMSVVYVKKNTSSGNGSFYHGCYGGNTLYLTGTANTNPYFHSFNVGTLPQDVWCISIGFIQANNDSNTANNPVGGVYRLDTGAQIYNSSSTFKMGTDSQIRQQHRAYLYYSTDVNQNMSFSDPGFYALDGSQPSISDLFGAGVPTPSSSSPWTTSGNDIYNSNSGNVGIGVTSPGAKLEIDGDVIYKNVNQYQTTVARTIEFTCYLQGSNTYTLIQFTQPSTNAQVMATIEFGGIITGNNSDRFAGSNSSITKYNGFSWYSSFVELGYVGNTSYRPQVIWDFGRLKLNVKSSTDNLFRIRLTYRGFGAAPTKTYPN